jgi:hypothetical protein
LATSYQLSANYNEAKVQYEKVLNTKDLGAELYKPLSLVTSIESPDLLRSIFTFVVRASFEPTAFRADDLSLIMGDTHVFYAGLLGDLGEPAKAETNALAALQDFEQTSDSTALRRLQTLFVLAGCYWEEGKVAESICMFEIKRCPYWKV